MVKKMRQLQIAAYVIVIIFNYFEVRIYELLHMEELVEPAISMHA